MTRRRHASGFSLVEMMVAMTILAVVVTAAMGMVIGMNASARHVRIVGDAQTAARLGLEQLAAEIRAAGAGVSTGQLGIDPAGGTPRRIPVIYSGPNVTITEPGGQTIITNSIFIIAADSRYTGVDVTNANQRQSVGMLGVVTAASANAPLTIICADATGASVDCKNDLIPNPQLPPLIVGDFRNAAYVVPTSLQAPGGFPATQQLAFLSSNNFSPNPKAPFGFDIGSTIQRARVTHWYLRQTPATAAPQLVRSFPTLTATGMNAACSQTDLPFLDETNSVTGPAGTVMGTMPVESLQIRFMTDPTLSDNPALFTMINTIGVCDTGVPATLREVRLQIVSRTTNVDLQGATTKQRVLYATPGYEGTTPTPGAGGVTNDSYPRRAFSLAVVPRNLQGYRL
jgi:prepilin-type N-terminal cleavage/methylation domain-containing protein